MLARGIKSTSVGGMRDRVIVRGLEIERELETTKMETLLYAQQLLHGNKDSIKHIEDIIKVFRKTMRLEYFTSAHAEKIQQDKARDADILTKLNKISK
jgi:hypothetical protein